MKKFITPILGAITLLSSSCSSLQSPQLYEEEIRDAVKYSLAVAAYAADQQSDLLVSIAMLFSDDQLLDEMEEYILEIYNNSDKDYRATLVSIANDRESDYRDEARELLKHYDTLRIDLSDYTPLHHSTTEKSWSFTELHSGIEFIFKIKNPDDAQPTWSCYPVEQSFDSYLEQLVLDLLE